MKQILVMLSFLAIAGVCGAQSTPADSTQSTDTAKTKNRQFFKRNVKNDSAFVVRLPAATDQGYSWQLIDSAFSDYVTLEKEDSKNQVKGQTGGAGIQVFHFRAVKPGTATIRFIYGSGLQKPFPKDAPRRIIRVVIS